MAEAPTKSPPNHMVRNGRRVVREPSSSLMRVPQHVAHAINAHIRQKKTIETRMTIKSSEIKIEQMVESFKAKRRAEQQKAQEIAEKEQSDREKREAREAAHEWAEQCKKDHKIMMQHRDDESAKRNEELRIEAVEMKKAVDRARDSQLEEDRTKIMLLKKEFADRKALYNKAKKKREEEEAVQANKMMEAYQKERAFVIAQREAEQQAMKKRLRDQKNAALAKREAAKKAAAERKAKERIEQAKVRAERKKLEQERLRMQLAEQEARKRANIAAKAARQKERELYHKQQKELALKQSEEMKRRREEEKAIQFAKVKQQQEEKAAKKLAAQESKKLAAAIAAKKQKQREIQVLKNREEQDRAKAAVRRRLEDQQKAMDAELDAKLRKAEETASRRMNLIAKLHKSAM